MRRRERRRVVGRDAVGPYTLLRIERGGLEPGVPGQFFMLEAPGRPLPRPMSLCSAPPGELGFLLEAVGPGTRALCAAGPGDELAVFGPLGNGYRLGVERPLLVGGGIGVAPFPYLSAQLGDPPAILGFRSDWHAEAAALVPNAQVVVEPTLVTEPLRDLATDCYKVLACGPEPMLEAVRELAPDAQLAWEAPMACGYGACFGCSVEIDGVLERLCVAGPVLQNGGTHGSPVGPLLPASQGRSRPWAPAGSREREFISRDRSFPASAAPPAVPVARSHVGIPRRAS